VYRTVRREGRQFRTLTTMFESAGATYHALAAASLDETLATLGEFRMLLLAMVPGVLAVACLGGYWISRRALAPVDEITRVAGSISVHNLSARLAVPGTGDEIERMSETWNEVLARLDTAVKRIRQFTADASHELRTPLALISGTAELALRRERPAEEYQKALRDIQVEAQRMTELTESLLTLARGDNGASLPLAETDLKAIVRDVAERSEPLATARGIALRAEAGDGTSVARVNAAGIRRLLLALVDNALRHTPCGGMVTVAVEGGRSEARLSVEDNGEGIAPEALPHIFDRFYRADAARSGETGAGLGLSIAQAIAHAHGSEITVRSLPGAGARFELVLRGVEACSEVPAPGIQ